MFGVVFFDVIAVFTVIAVIAAVTAAAMLLLLHNVKKVADTAKRCTTRVMRQTKTTRNWNGDSNAKQARKKAKKEQQQ